MTLDSINCRGYLPRGSFPSERQRGSKPEPGRSLALPLRQTAPMRQSAKMSLYKCWFHFENLYYCNRNQSRSLTSSTPQALNSHFKTNPDSTDAYSNHQQLKAITHRGPSGALGRAADSPSTQKCFVFDEETSGKQPLRIGSLPVQWQALYSAVPSEFSRRLRKCNRLRLRL